MNITMNTVARRCGLALLALLSICSMLACDGEPRSRSLVFHSVDITGANYARDFSMTDMHGKVRYLNEFTGRVVMVFFGYTQCPDVCPTTLAEISALRQALGDAGKNVQPIFITLDPVRDTSEILRAYLANFGDDVIGLRGSVEQTQQAAKAFKVYFKQVQGKTPDTYTLDHTAGTYVFDTQGQLRLFTRYVMPPQQLQQDVSALLAEAN